MLYFNRLRYDPRRPEWEDRAFLSRWARAPHDVRSCGRDRGLGPAPVGIKVISALLAHLPAGHEYRIIFMRRGMEEVLASQRHMLVRRGEPADATGDAAMASVFDKHLQRVAAWLVTRPEIRRLDVDHAVLMAEPAVQAARVSQFLGGRLDMARMAAVVDSGLHRQRAGDAGPATTRG